MRPLIVAILLLVLVGFSAQAGSADAIPAELIAGTVGGAAFGVGGGAIMLFSCLAEAEGFGALACIGAAVIGYALGVPVGATLGVNVAGSLSGVQGNLLLSALGAVGGEALGLGITALVAQGAGGLPEPLGWTMFLGVIPFLSSAGATWGYNVGAQATGTSALQPQPEAY
jgi:hypothetical protein